MLDKFFPFMYFMAASIGENVVVVAGISVVVQFYPWFKFYFLCFKLIIYNSRAPHKDFRVILEMFILSKDATRIR